MRNLAMITALTLLSACGAHDASTTTDTVQQPAPAASTAPAVPSIEGRYSHGDVVYIVPDCIPMVVFEYSNRYSEQGWLLESPTAPSDLVFIKDKYISPKCPDNP